MLHGSKLTEITKNEKSLQNALLLQISVCDISENMLGVGRRRAEALGHHGIDWVCGDAQQLPFEEGEFDCYTIAFGIRNVVDIQKVSEIKIFSFINPIFSYSSDFFM